MYSVLTRDTATIGAINPTTINQNDFRCTTRPRIFHFIRCLFSFNISGYVYDCIRKVTSLNIPLIFNTKIAYNQN